MVARRGERAQQNGVGARRPIQERDRPRAPQRRRSQSSILDSMATTLNGGLSALNSRVNRVEQGVAMAMAAQNPVLTGSDRFGVTVNWGNYDGNDSVGFSAVGIIGQNFFGQGEKVGMTGGFAMSGNQVAGRAGLQFTMVAASVMGGGFGIVSPRPK